MLGANLMMDYDVIFDRTRPKLRVGHGVVNAWQMYIRESKNYEMNLKKEGIISLKEKTTILTCIYVYGNFPDRFRACVMSRPERPPPMLCWRMRRPWSVNDRPLFAKNILFGRAYPFTTSMYRTHRYGIY